MLGADMRVGKDGGISRGPDDRRQHEVWLELNQGEHAEYVEQYLSDLVLEKSLGSRWGSDRLVVNQAPRVS